MSLIAITIILILIIIVIIRFIVRRSKDAGRCKEGGNVVVKTIRLAASHIKRFLPISFLQIPILFISTLYLGVLTIDSSCVKAAQVIRHTAENCPPFKVRKHSNKILSHI